jgi:anaerobic magnesium-protoporphyrin IX monomethyl ester cyclase
MRIQLIHPPICTNPKAIQATRPSLPLGLAYVAAALREAGHEVSVLDAVIAAPARATEDYGFTYFGLRPDEIAECIDPAADAIGLTTMFSFQWPLSRAIANAVKAAHPSKLLIGGGEHFTGMSEYSLRQAPLDFVVRGEGEATAQELFAALSGTGTTIEGVPGLAFLRAGRYVETAKRVRIREVDALRWPAWDYFDPVSYYRAGFIFGVDEGMTMPILATRGCPYACTYCSNPGMWGRSWFARSPQDVAEEIDTYHRRYGATSFPFHDLTAILKKSWIVAFCEELIRRDLRITWQLPIGTRVEAVDAEVARLLRRTNGRSLTFAPESGSARTRALIAKKMTEEDLMAAVRASVGAGLNVSSFFVVGFPHDTWRDLSHSVRLAARLAWAGTNDIALSYFFPIPSTELFDQLVASGRITVSDEFLRTPLESMNVWLSAKNNYCEHLGPRLVTLMKWLILGVFYSVSFAARPWRLPAMLWNGARGKETCRLDTFLNGQRKRLLARLGRALKMQTALPLA